MFPIFNDRPDMLVEAQNAKFKPNLIIQFLIFVAIFFLIQFVQGAPVFVITLIMGFKLGFDAAKSGEILDANSPQMLELGDKLKNVQLVGLYLTALAIVLVVVYCKYFEKRSLYSMGLAKKNAAKDYLVGLAIGFVMLTTCVLIGIISGSVVFEGFVLGNGIFMLILFFVGFMIQGMSEEVILRGYFMVSVSTRNSVLVAILANSVLFAFLHILNSGITFLAILNLILFGVFASVYALKMNSLWGVCAIHTMWNFAQGNIFGIKVSGMDTQVSLFRFHSVQSGEWINGGAFGLEGGFAVTLVLVIGILAVMLWAKYDKQKNIVQLDVPS